MRDKDSGLMTMKEAGAFLHVSNTTIRRWVNEGKLAACRTDGGHRRFFKEDLLKCVGGCRCRAVKRLTVGYCRVSSSGQKEGLLRQEQVVSRYCEQNGYRFRIIRDIGSGINYRKKGLTELIRLVCSGEAERIVVNYKDRLVRFGYEMLEEVCRLNEVEIEIINSTSEDSDEEELVKDVLSIITVFSSRLYGKRSHKNKDIIKENRRMFQIEESKEAGKEAEEETHL